MQTQQGKLEGTGEIRDKNGRLKGTITISSPYTETQARKLGLVPPAQEKENGSNSRISNTERTG